jgi:primosomal protein N' (replication factor Y)
VGLLHSGLTPGQQYDTWWRIRGGEFDVVLGSRSAIFAPQPDLGLIVLDEEHEWTYKQSDASPRYHARDVALRLAELCGAAVVLGSATPDVGSRYLAERGEHRLLELPSRVRTGPGGGPVPAPLARAEVVDMRDELKAGVRGIFSRALQGALRETLDRGEQAILFLNRRGAGGAVQCRDCGHALRCHRCETALTYHAEGDRLVCHRCGRASRAVPRCPVCRSPRIRHLGLGTQRVVQEVDRLFGVRALRWDRDAARERDAHRTLMDSFARGEARVLVGTQMVAQGLHLPMVTLVGVVLADLGLQLPDFRAGERAFQLLCQVSGRAGRGERPGRVIVQTYAPDHYAVEAGAAQDYQGFYEREIAYRLEHRNPPFARLARLLFQHTSAQYCQEEAQRMAQRIRDLCRSQGLSEVDVIGPAPGFPPRLRGRHRWTVTVRVPPSTAVDMPSLLDALPLRAPWTVDVDPVGLA